LAGERFCGACGGNRADLLRQRLGSLETQEVQARSLQVAGKYDEALRLLAKLIAHDHPALAETVSTLRSLQREVQRERDALAVRQNEALAVARKALAGADDDAAIAALEAVPRQVRAEETQTLLDEMLARRREAATLQAAIGEALVQKRYAGLLPKVERLLHIRPQHPQARQLVEKLRNFEQHSRGQQREVLCQQGTERLKAGDYAQALALLEQIDPLVRTPESDRLLAIARETDWLRRDLAAAHPTSEHRRAMAEKLRKIKANDPEARRVLAEPTASDDPESATDAAATQVSPAFGCPIGVLRGLRRVQLSPDLAATEAFRDHDGAFGVAVGLALQGLGRSELSINLRPSGRGLLGKLLSTQIRLRPAAAAWGLDLGRSALKAVRLVAAAPTDPVSVAAVEYVPFSQPLSQPDADADGIVREALDVLAKRHELQRDPLCLSLLGQDLFTRFFHTPPIEARRLVDLVHYEVRNQIPFDLEQLTWDYQVLGEVDERDTMPREFDVIVFAARTTTVERRVEALAERGWRCEVVQSDAAALHNCYVYDRLGEAADDKAARPLAALLDLGADSANFVVSGRDFIWFRHLLCGSAEWTKAIVRLQKLTWAKAEAFKREPARAPLVHQLYTQALDPVTDELVVQLQHTQRCFVNVFPNRSVQRMLLAGDGARLHGLLPRLRRAT
jgi:type IV pilus assembly protein PilM